MSAPAAHSPSQTQGAAAAVLCYFLWGLVPLYWRELSDVGSIELIAHRHIWSLLLLLGVVAAQDGFGSVRDALRGPEAIARNGLSAVLLTTNWLVYVWGVNSGQVIETSLGYFLVPLVNVAAGRFVLHEHMRRAQWLAIGVAALGVAVMVAQLGRPPWIALILAATWGSYSLMRKKSPLPPVTALTVETLLLAPFAIGFLIWCHATGDGILGRVNLRLQFLVLASGVVTAVPLLLFAYSARRIRLSTLGLLQYVAPTVQLILGIWVFRERFPLNRIIGFSVIWAALALYTADNLLVRRRGRLP